MYLLCKTSRRKSKNGKAKSIHVEFVKHTCKTSASSKNKPCFSYSEATRASEMEVNGNGFFAKTVTDV